MMLYIAISAVLYEHLSLEYFRPRVLDFLLFCFLGFLSDRGSCLLSRLLKCLHAYSQRYTLLLTKEYW